MDVWPIKATWSGKLSNMGNFCFCISSLHSLSSFNFHHSVISLCFGNIVPGCSKIRFYSFLYCEEGISRFHRVGFCLKIFHWVLFDYLHRWVYVIYSTIQIEECSVTSHPTFPDPVLPTTFFLPSFYIWIFVMAFFLFTSQSQASHSVRWQIPPTASRKNKQCSSRI